MKLQAVLSSEEKIIVGNTREGRIAATVVLEATSCAPGERDVLNGAIGHDSSGARQGAA